MANTPNNQLLINKKKPNLIDDLLSQLENDKVAPEPEESTTTIEITEQVQQKLMDLMDAYNEGQKKVAQVKLLTKQINAKQNAILEELKTMMRLCGLKNLVRGEKEFVLDEGPKKKALPKGALKAVMSEILGDEAKVNEIYSKANERAGEKYVSKVKPQAYKGD